MKRTVAAARKQSSNFHSRDFDRSHIRIRRHVHMTDNVVTVMTTIRPLLSSAVITNGGGIASIDMTGSSNTNKATTAGGAHEVSTDRKNN
jgi:20S proteasome alpha/beta subunit